MMSKYELKSEADYLYSVRIVKSLLDKNLITEEEYNIICTKLREEYRPIISTLLSGERLAICFYLSDI